MSGGNGKNPFESAHQKKMQAIFEKARERSELTPGNRQQNALDDRLQRVKAKLADHTSRHRPAWVARENSKLVALNKGKLKPSLSPKGILQTETSPAAIAQRAYQNVDHRIAKRMEKLEAIANRARNRLASESAVIRKKNSNCVDM